MLEVQYNVPSPSHPMVLVPPLVPLLMPLLMHLLVPLLLPVLDPLLVPPLVLPLLIPLPVPVSWLKCSRHANQISPSAPTGTTTICKEFPLVWEWSELRRFDVVRPCSICIFGEGVCLVIEIYGYFTLPFDLVGLIASLQACLIIITWSCIIHCIASFLFNFVFFV